LPIVSVAENSAATFLVPAADANGDRLRWRISTDAEAGGGPSPPNMAINPDTGQVTWNNVGLSQSGFWTVQVIIEDLDANGNIKTQNPVDFLLRIIPVTSAPPVCAITPSGPLVAPLGTPVSFVVTGTDPDTGATLELNTSGLPIGATMTPGLPATGTSGLQSTFNWTPALNQVGPNLISFSVTDNTGLQAICTISLQVIAPTSQVSDQKAGSILVWPYYHSRLAEKKDTRLTLSNLGAKSVFVHLFLIEGTSCQQADQFLCLTQGASFSFKASDYDPEATGWALAIAVDERGQPIQNNGLIGNAFVNEGNLVDSYGAEAFAAHSTTPATINNETATLHFDGVGYEKVPSRFVIEIQSPLDALNQRIVTVGLRGNLNQSQVTGAGQVGTGTVYNGDEKLVGSFTNFLSGNCQAQALLSASTPRVPGGLSKGIPAGQNGTLQLSVGAAVGLLMTPRTATWNGIRTLSHSSLTTSTLTIPIFAPAC
jgi:hypothetical protein